MNITRSIYPAINLLLRLRSNELRGLIIAAFFPPNIYNMSGKYGDGSKQWGIYRYDAEENVVYLFDSYTDYLEAEAFRIGGMFDLALNGYDAEDDEDAEKVADAGHLVLITGYNDALNMFEYRNSKGPLRDTTGTLEGYFGRWTLTKLDERDKWDGYEPTPPPGDWTIPKKGRFSTRNNCRSIPLQQIINEFPQFNLTETFGDPDVRMCRNNLTSYGGLSMEER